MAMENKNTPTGLILTRQDVNDIPSVSGDRYADAQGVRRGGYVLKDVENPAIVLVGNGSEVSLLWDVAAKLEEEGVAARVVSVPSIGLYNAQDAEYKATGIPAGVPVFGLTAGLTSVLSSVVGANGKIYGLERFGASAPFKVLDEKFGFTTENILKEVKAML